MKQINRQACCEYTGNGRVQFGMALKIGLGNVSKEELLLDEKTLLSVWQTSGECLRKIEKERARAN